MVEKVPRLLPGVDIRKFKLDPMDGFLVTRIDGKLGPKDLARETGLPEFSVVRALEKLEKLGIIEIADPNAPPPEPAPEPAPTPQPTPSSAPEPPKERRSAVATFDVGLLAPKYDPAELDEPVEIAPEQKKRILDFYYRLDDLDHYTLLGITGEANKKGIKRAYFELAAQFHPDRYFNKNLGTFKPKMEVLFNRITEAHDTLVDVDKRAEYDAYLAEVATTRGMEAMLERAMAESARATAEAEAEAAQAAEAAAREAAHPPVQATTPSLAPVASPAPTAEEIQRRRETLARRLTGGARAPASRPPPDKVPQRPYPTPQEAMDALKRRYEERIEGVTQAHASRYLQAAEDALARNDVVAASAAFTLATRFAPGDAALAARAQEVKQQADELLSESYLKQAEYEERQGHFTEASRSWRKLAKLRDDVTSHEKAASALLKSPDGDLHEAAEHAKRAIMLQPRAINNHVTLVEIYLKAGLTASARRTAEAAITLEPQHAGLQALLRRIGKT